MQLNRRCYEQEYLTFFDVARSITHSMSLARDLKDQLLLMKDMPSEQKQDLMHVTNAPLLNLGSLPTEGGLFQLLQLPGIPIIWHRHLRHP